MTLPDPDPVFAVDRVLALVNNAIQAIADAATALSVALPSRVVVAAAAVPFDCEQVLAYIQSIRTAAPEAGRNSGGGTYPNPGAQMTLYQATVQLTIVRGTATLPAQSGVGQTAPAPSSYLNNLTTASGDAAVLLHAANLAETRDGMYGVGAAPRTVTFSAPQGGLVAAGCSVTLLA